MSFAPNSRAPRPKRDKTPRDHPLTLRYEELLREPVTFPQKRECLRINALLAPKDIIKRIEAVPAKLVRVPFLPDAYWYESARSLGATPEYLMGYYYLQEAASQLPVLVLNPPAGARVLDMAAAPGSKTTQLAAVLDNSGVIVALELKNNRMESLVENLERCGVTNTVVYRKDARFAKDLGTQFTHILLDAPCSGNPVIEPRFFETKTVEGIKEMQLLQRELIRSAMQVLAPHGILVYSTCSLEPEENEANIAWALREYPELELLDTGLTVGEPGYTSAFGESFGRDFSKTRRLWPQKSGTQAFFVAKLHRRK